VTRWKTAVFYRDVLCNFLVLFGVAAIIICFNVVVVVVVVVVVDVAAFVDCCG